MPTEEPNDAAIIYRRIVSTWLSSAYERDLKAMKESVEKINDVKLLEELQEVFQNTKDFVKRRQRLGELLERDNDGAL